tara:strand:+ start:285 stop:533 length:249 start_codon:yes stop_codon:yes gene_type:complete
MPSWSDISIFTAGNNQFVRKYLKVIKEDVFSDYYNAKGDDPYRRYDLETIIAIDSVFKCLDRNLQQIEDGIFESNSLEEHYE